MGIISVLKNVIIESTILRIICRKIYNRLKLLIFMIRGIKIKTDEKMVIFGAYNGKSYACSPKAIYEYMINNEEYAEYKFIWMFDNTEKYQFLEENMNTVIVKTQTARCEKYLHQAKYWVLNFRALDHWRPRKSQIYIQCWHGTPLKRLGYDITISDNAMNSIYEIREKYRSDARKFNYIISSCDFVSKKFNSAWNLNAFGKGDRILKSGYPRNDFLNTYTSEDVKNIKHKLKIFDSDKKIILYAPTWRDNQHNVSKGYVYDNPVDFNFIKRELSDDYIILFRAHYLVADRFDFTEYRDFIYDVSTYDDINELYIIADMLITDYSSVFFDYAILEKPMLFYMYDMREYRDEIRGFYLDINELPGSIVKNEMELVDSIDKEINAFDVGKIRIFNEKYNSMNDGYATKRLSEIIFKNKS